MKELEVIVYILFVLAIFFAFGMYLYSAIVLLIAFILIDKIKKYDKRKAKKLNYVGIGIVIFLVIMVLLMMALASIFLSGLLGKLK
jgi:hypothetical protein